MQRQSLSHQVQSSTSMEYWEPRKRTSPEKLRNGRTTTNHRSPTNRLRNPRNSFTSFRFSPSSASSSSTSPLTIRLKQFGGFHRLSRPIDSTETVLVIRSLRNSQESEDGLKYRRFIGRIFRSCAIMLVLFSLYTLPGLPCSEFTDERERIGGGLATTNPEGGAQIGRSNSRSDMASRPLFQKQNRGETVARVGKQNDMAADR
ncbi:Potassium voltage-gated channel subfamily H member 7 like [Actinidia chinensis var. chinensis]|uniref:Potassium voltage-gated channel subfamily H member 7 like n=1 Tax=Actinidia chinensis var. chinensis TaxID=1590841 RepID=A0A2R6PCJ2_ACTCC|nr:Potassium voltage-gated channel subfamily H member 7 like [Actinidia chinensis var. chinensis]